MVSEQHVIAEQIIDGITFGARREVTRRRIARRLTQPFHVGKEGVIVHAGQCQGVGAQLPGIQVGFSRRNAAIVAPDEVRSQVPRVTRRGYANLLIDIRSQRWDVIAEKHDHRGLVQVAQLRDERFQRRIALLQKPAIVGQNGASAVAHLVGKGRLRAVGYAKVVIVIAAMILHGQAEDEVAPFCFRKLMQNGAVVLLVADKHALFFKGGHGGVQRKKAVKAQHTQIMVTVVVHAVIPVDGRGLISPVP